MCMDLFFDTIDSSSLSLALLGFFLLFFIISADCLSLYNATVLQRLQKNVSIQAETMYAWN